MYHHRPNYATPGDPPNIEIVPGLGWNANWRFNQSGEDLGTNWATSANPIGGDWESGDGPLGYETSAGVPPEPLVTQLNRPQDNDPRVITFYFETEFNVDASDLADITSLKGSHVTDDGAVYYLNGNEIHRFDMPDGPVTASTLAMNLTATEARDIQVFDVDPTFLVAGTNRLSVEVHQSSSGSSDVVMGLKLDLEKSTPGANPPAPFSENSEEWIELYNRSANPVILDNWEFEGAIDFTFPANTQIPSGSYLVVARDLADFSAKFPGVTAVGDYSGSLSNSGDRLSLIDQFNNPVDDVFYADGTPWPDAADGGGSSMELRHPELDNNTPSSWAASDNSTSSDWKTYTYTITAHTPVYKPGQFNFHEIRLGLLDSGELLIDDFSVIEDPGGADLELIANNSFDTTTGWRLLGTHQILTYLMTVVTTSSKSSPPPVRTISTTSSNPISPTAALSAQPPPEPTTKSPSAPNGSLGLPSSASSSTTTRSPNSSCSTNPKPTALPEHKTPATPPVSGPLFPDSCTNPPSPPAARPSQSPSMRKIPMASTP